MNDLEALKLQVLALPAADRASLIEDIQASFDPKVQETVDKDKADEIERRRKAYREGRVGTVTLEESR